MHPTGGGRNISSRYKLCSYNKYILESGVIVSEVRAPPLAVSTVTNFLEVKGKILSAEEAEEYIP